VFVHGWHANGSVWDPIVEAVGERARTIAVDLRGHGASNGAPGPYGLETFSGDLGDLIAALDLDPVVVVGHSMGAAVAQRFAIDSPEAVEGLVLVAAVPASGVPFPPRIEAIFRSTAGNPEAAARWLAGMAPAERPPEIAKLLNAAAASVPPEVALESLEAWLRADFADEAATIETPTLVIAPRHDRPMTPDFLRDKVADVILGSRFEVLEEAGHYAPVEQPERIAALIEAFIASL
jgi:pimeloyl-ACP methyl ester carboxylesterase